MKFERTVVVGDLHGQYEIARRIIADTKNYYNVVFVGDYLDSFHRDPADQLTTINTVVGAAQCEPDRVVGLLGNHELSYLMDQPCGGWNRSTFELVHPYREVYLDVLKTHHWIDDHYLVTHAGVPIHGLPPYTNVGWVEEVERYIASQDAYAVGYARGGRCRQGGIYWQDWYAEFEPIEGIPQIVGHSRGQGIREKAGNYCVDCLEDGYNDVLIVHADLTVEVRDYNEL